MLISLILEADSPRLDRFLTDLYPEIPRSRWEGWIRAGQVRINGEPATKPGAKLKAKDLLETEKPVIEAPASHLLPEDLDIPTLFEDERLWILNKPAGMVVHPGPGHVSGTVLNALLGRLHCPAEMKDIATEASEEDDEVPLQAWPGLVHRLDRYTTGCMATAKDSEAQAHLQAQFKARTVEKRYLALVRNGRRLPILGSLLIDEPIARHRVDRMKMTISAAGRTSQTRISVLGRAANLALVECELLTGRTHQIRVHLSHLGSPILGDRLYGGASRWQDEDKQPILCEHPMLHAWKLNLDHPDGRRIETTAPLPEPFQALLDRLGLSV